MHTDAELTEILNRGENDHVEFTASVRDLDKIRQAICAFANDLPNHRQPGVVFIGIADNGSCANVTIDDELLQTLGGLRDDGKLQPFPMMEVARKTLNGCTVAVIQVVPSDNPPVRMDNRCWIRTGPRKGRATPDEERRLTEKRRWGILPYDMHGVPNASVEHHLDMNRFTSQYLPVAVPPDVLRVNKRDPRDQLKALRLIAEDGTLTVTAILVLGNDPNYWFSCAYIQFARFAGYEITDAILDQREIHGTLPDQLTELVTLLKAHIMRPLDTSGLTHKETADYPLEALRELVHNAVIHRNYENSWTPVKIYWFVDRIEIISPGSTYGGVTKDNFEGGVTAYRNPTIAEAMKNMGFIQRFGMGISTAQNALIRNGNPKAEFTIEDTTILATVKSRQ